MPPALSIDPSAARHSLRAAMANPGVVGLALVDVTSGSCIASVAQGEWAGLIERAAAGNVSVVRAKQQVMRTLGLQETIEDILITLESQYHLIRPVAGRSDVFLYAVLARAQTTLVMARFRLMELDREFAR